MTKPLLLVVMIWGLFLLALISRNADLAWMTLPFLVYLIVGIWQSPSPKNIRLRATRSVNASRGKNVTSIKVKVTIINEGTDLDRLCCYDTPLSEMRLKGGSLSQTGAVRTGDIVEIQYDFQARRGNFAWTTVNLKASDSLGLVETEFQVPAAAEVQVQPEVDRFKPFPLHPQDTVHAAGSIPARLGGSGTDFWGVREYHVGDPLRRLDWRLTARHPGQLFSKEFEQEEITNIGFILDARRITDVQLGEDHLHEHAARATVSLAEVFLRQGNRVGLLINCKPIVTVFPGYGKLQLNRIQRALSEATTQDDSKPSGLGDIPLRMFPHHSLIVVISPLGSAGPHSLTNTDRYLFPRLKAMGYQVLLISPDPFDYAQPILPTDTMTQLATRLARVTRHMEISKIAQLWIPVIDWQVSQPLAPLVHHALSRHRTPGGR